LPLYGKDLPFADFEQFNNTIIFAELPLIWVVLSPTHYLAQALLCLPHVRTKQQRNKLKEMEDK